MKFPSFKKESEHFKQGYSFVAGCDEVGVAPLAGPVVAAACVLDHASIGKYRSKKKWYSRVRDSKTTSEAEREILLKEILAHSLAWGIGEVWQADIDRLNIHRASLLAMRLAAEELLKKIPAPKKKMRSDKILIFIDGRFKIPDLAAGNALQVDQKSMIGGDNLVLSVAAASIIAKVHRDKIMHRLDKEFPVYGFAKHKGYSTKEHRKAIKKYGISPLHRKSFLNKK